MLWRMKLVSPSRTVSIAGMKYLYCRTTQNMKCKNKLLILKLLCSPLQLQKAAPVESVIYFLKHLFGISYICSFPGHNEHGISKYFTASIIQLTSLTATGKEDIVNQARGGTFFPPVWWYIVTITVVRKLCGFYKSQKLQQKLSRS